MQPKPLSHQDTDNQPPLAPESQEQLHALVRAARQILHDINNTITPVSLDTEVMLADEPNLSDSMREYLENVQHAIDDISEAIARMHAMREEHKAPPVAAPVRGAARALHILLVDDDAPILDSMRAVLEGEGHHVRAAESGLAALDAFKMALHGGTQVDVVITDLGMPNMDGWQVARAIKTLKPAVQVILLTGWNQPASNDVVPEIDYMLAKPPQIDELNKALDYCAARLEAAAQDAAS